MVTAMAAPTPNGARYITYRVKRNITSANDPKKLTTGSAFGSDGGAGRAEEESEHHDLQGVIASQRVEDAGGDRVFDFESGLRAGKDGIRGSPRDETPPLPAVPD